MLSSSQISHIAKLAKLRLEPDEAEGLGEDLSRMLDYVALLDTVELDPQPALDSTSGVTGLRVDATRPGLDAQSMLQNAPESLDRFLLVPAIK